MPRLRVGVIFGGRSGEHEVSLASAASVIAALEQRGHPVVPIGIGRDGRWVVGGDPMRALAEQARVALPSGDETGAVKKALADRAEGVLSAESERAGALGARRQRAERAAPGTRRGLHRAARSLRRGRHHPGTAGDGRRALRRRRRARLGRGHGQGHDEDRVRRARPADRRAPGRDAPRVARPTRRGGRARSPSASASRASSSPRTSAPASASAR